MTPDEISRETLVRQLLDSGVEPGGVLLVHTAFSKVRPVAGGPSGLIAAPIDGPTAWSFMRHCHAAPAIDIRHA